jgi:hypothetical protein
MHGSRFACATGAYDTQQLITVVAALGGWWR